MKLYGVGEFCKLMMNIPYQIVNMLSGKKLKGQTKRKKGNKQTIKQYCECDEVVGSFASYEEYTQSHKYPETPLI